MKVEMVPIVDLVLDEDNARIGDVQELMKGLSEFGQHRAVVARGRAARNPSHSAWR